ncbi:uncharacterized protein [Hoplias malabaricus]|uniref:uncharacterized protein isoform X1 n=2 Tax=Hoplias malabaricus TaxID=27720 RepID=UPI00346303C1
MMLLSLILLGLVLDKCCGQTQIIYTTKKKESITCETKKWQISTDSNNIIDLNCTEGCYHLTIEFEDDDEKRCEKKDNKPNFCLLKVKSGFVACVNRYLPGFLFPFKRSPNVLQSFIVAVPDKNMTSEPEKTSSLTVTEGESVDLNCSFTFTKGHDGNEFVVYWIKTKGQSSTCLYSYDFSMDYIKVGHHCKVEETLYKRLSNRTIEKLTHIIGISGVMESDSGQYLCALHMGTSKTEKTNVKWKVIERVTVRVNKDKTSQSPETTRTVETPEKKHESVPKLLSVYIAVPVLLCVLLVVVVVFIKKRRMISQGSQSAQKSCNSREDNLYTDCSPYAIGTGEEEHHFAPKKESSRMLDPGCKGSTPALDPYSVVRLNSLYE